MRVYLAAPYSAKEAIKGYAAELQALGIEVTSSWLKEPHAPNTQMHELTHEEHARYANQDIEDILAAFSSRNGAFVFFTDPTGSIVRGGRHVEFGIAVMLARMALGGFPIYVIGEPENIFHHLDGVFHEPTWDAIKTKLRDRARV